MITRYFRPRCLFPMLAAILFLFGAISSQAQVTTNPFPVKPGPVTLQLRTSNGKSQFHRGELIPLELVFSSPERRYYTIGEECMPYDTYRYSISPPALDRRLDGDAGMFMYFGNCHGFSSRVDPGEKPVVMQQLLNHRYRIEKPGAYTVSVTSIKFGFPLQSNELQIEILPSDSAWEQSELARATSLLSSQLGSQSWQEGCNVLIYLETPDAEVEMARREGANPYPCDFDIPLISARNRKPVLDQLEKGLSEPARVITGNYLSTLTFVSLYQQHPDLYPAPPEDQPSLQPSEFYPSRQRSLWSERNAIQQEKFRYARLLASSLHEKTPEARSRSFLTILYLGDFSGSEVPADLVELGRREMPSAFVDLPLADRDAVLYHQWDDIKSPAMLSVLLDLVVKSHWLGGNGIALIRLNELSPADARAVILEQLRSPSPQGSVAALSLLPEKELPELDAILLQRLKDQQNDAAMAFSAGLLRRYASSAVAPDLKPWFSGKIGKTYCGTEAELITYFLRVAPSDGAAMLRDAMKSDYPGCNLLRRVAELQFPPEVEKQALAALDDPRPAIVQEALQILRENGSPATREIMQRHFRAWHDRWANRAKELSPPNSANEAGIENAYRDAIGFARNWLFSVADWRSLQQLCVTSDCKSSVEQTILSLSSYQPMIGAAPTVGDDFQQTFGLGGCFRCTFEQLKEKMLQYPPATKFHIDARFGRQTRFQRIFAELQPWAVAHGFSLELYRD